MLPNEEQISLEETKLNPVACLDVHLICVLFAKKEKGKKKFSLVSVDVGLFQTPRKKIISIHSYSHAM